MKRILLHIISLVFVAMVMSCSSSDCPLTNTVMQKVGFYSSDGSQLTVGDTLTVMVSDSVILNRLTGGTSVRLPMSYSAAADTLVFCFTPEGATMPATDTIVIDKTNTPHFVSLDCARSMFHTITAVSWSRRSPDETYTYAIDSVALINPEVNYEEKENLQIYFSVYH